MAGTLSSSRYSEDRCLAGHRVLLAHPGIYDDIPARFYPPWGLLCIGTRLRQAGAEVQVLDLNGENIAEAAEKAMAELRPTAIGLTAKMGLGARRLQRLVQTIRSRDTSLPIAVGGPLVASYPQYDHPLWSGVDRLFLGDGEETLLGWLADGCPQGRVIGPAETTDLDRVGIPVWWDDLAEYIWPAESIRNMGVESLYVASGRGCTRRCTFCYLNTQYPGTRFRFVSAARLVSDLDALHERLGVRGFYFIDDCFIDHPASRVRQICSLLVRRGTPYRLGCNLQLGELGQQRLLQSMYRAGFRCLYIGLEAASQQVRRRLGKSHPGEPVVDAIHRALDLGFFIHASVGIGWPGESERDVVDTLALIDKIPGLAVDAFCYHPLPGTPLSQRRNSYGASANSCRQPFEDFSEFHRNYSDLSESIFSRLWQELVERRDERYQRLFDDGEPYAAASQQDTGALSAGQVQRPDTAMKPVG